MSKFSIGDKIKRISGLDHHDVVLFGEYIVSAVYGTGYVKLEGSDVWYDEYYFKLAEENKMQKQFTKNDLKDWMRVITRDSYCYIVSLDKKILIRENGQYIRISVFNDDLTTIVRHLEVLDIIKVYSAPEEYNKSLDNKAKGDLLWKREEKSPEQIEAENITKEIESLKLRLEELSKKL